MTIAATADVHLGMTFAAYHAHRVELSEERFAALERVVATANDRGAELLVIAGDLFHRVGVAARVVERAAAIIDRFAGAAAAVLPGNHDYLAPGDRLWSACVDAAGDRTVLLDRPGAFDLAPYDLPLILLAAPCDAMHGASHRLDWAAAYDRPGEMPVIGVAHGSIEGLTLDSEGRYFPMSRALLRSLPADLWIVGHTHRFHDEPEVGLVVPGTPAPDGFDCPVTGSAAIITMDSMRLASARAARPYEVNAVRTGRFVFVETSVTLHEPECAKTSDELRDEVLRALPDGEAFVRVTVDGLLADEAFGRWNAARQELLDDPRILRVDDEGLVRLLGRVDVDRRYAGGSFAHRLLTRLVDADDRDALAEALSLMEEIEP